MNLLFRAIIGIPFTPFSSYIVILNYFIAKKKKTMQLYVSLKKFGIICES